MIPLCQCSWLLSFPCSNMNKLLSYVPASDRETGWPCSCLLLQGLAIRQSSKTGRECIGGRNTWVFLTPWHPEPQQLMPEGLIWFTNWHTLGLKRLLIQPTCFSLQWEPQQSNFFLTLYTTATTTVTLINSYHFFHFIIVNSK